MLLRLPRRPNDLRAIGTLNDAQHDWIIDLGLDGRDVLTRLNPYTLLAR